MLSPRHCGQREGRVKRSLFLKTKPQLRQTAGSIFSLRPSCLRDFPTWGRWRQTSFSEIPTIAESSLAE